MFKCPMDQTVIGRSLRQAVSDFRHSPVRRPFG
jgi:hypothetical protein